MKSNKFLAAGIVVGAALGLQACGSSVPGSVGAGEPSSSGGAVKSGWTTLGTREASSKATTVSAPNASQWTDYNPPAQYPGVVTTKNVFITMPDGVQLAANVTQPADASGNAAPGQFPTVLVQTGYNKDAGIQETGGGADTTLVEHGYVQVTVDERGTGRSQGEWHSFDAVEQADYPVVVNWVTQQPWSNGKVGLQGASLLAITALLTAAQQPPGVVAMFAEIPMGDSYRDIVFQGGELNAGFIPLWLGLVTGLSVLDPTIFTAPQESLTAELSHVEGAVVGFQVPQVLNSVVGDPSTVYDGDFWKVRSPLDHATNINIPTFVIGGLHCIFQRGEPLLYETIKQHAPSKLLLGPWTHVQMGQGLPVDGVPAIEHIELQWFDQYLKGMDVGADKQPNVTQYVYGYDHYVTSTDWPNPDAQAQRYYLHGDKSVSTQAPAADEATNTVLQEPANGLCSESSDQWTAGLLGMVDVTKILPCFTDDTLTEALEAKFDTAPLTDDLYFNGPIEADVWVSTTAQDAPVVVRVDDVDASGSAFPLTNGIMQASMSAVDASKARYLDGVMIEPWHPFLQSGVQAIASGTPVLVQVEVFPTSAMIAKGHKLRISVGASDLPHGLPPAPALVKEAAGVMTVYSDAAHPSLVVLPVMPAGALPPS
ncbi:MAG TPA: CocE/NonD family hydrolase [Nevskiaceae bacterium]|nr:CocE/NonD family hydrolase [Nevskiaceae bacterium]